MAIYAAQEQQRNKKNKQASAVSPLPRRARSHQLAQDEAQVESSHVDQLPLQNVIVSAQVGAPHAARVVAMRKAAFHQLAAPPQYALAVLTLHPPPILVYRLLFGPLALPLASSSLLLFRNVAAHLIALHPLQYCPAMVTLVGNHLFDTVDVDFGLILGPLLRFPSDLFRHRQARLAQRGIQGRGVAPIRALQRHRYYRSRIQIDGVLGLVCQVGTSILHLRNPRILIRRALPFFVRHPLLAFPVQPRQDLARRRLQAGGLRQPQQKLLVALPRLPPHNRTHRRVGLQRRRINANPLPPQQPTIRQ